MGLDELKMDNFDMWGVISLDVEDGKASRSGRGLDGAYDELYRDYVSIRHVKNRHVGDWVYGHEESCDGEFVGVLPYCYDESMGMNWFLLRREYVPCWNQYVKNLCLLSGQCDAVGVSAVEMAVRELEEECGYAVSVDQMVSLGRSFVGKGIDSVYSLFAVDLGEEGVRWSDPVGDGSRGEEKADCVWVGEESFFTMDPVLAQAYCRFSFGAFFYHE